MPVLFNLIFSDVLFSWIDYQDTLLSPSILFHVKHAGIYVFTFGYLVNVKQIFRAMVCTYICLT